jgi:long-chain acyl-CoA synthetase
VIEPEEVVRQVKDSEPSVLVTLSMWAGLAKQIQEGSGVPHIILTDPAEYLLLPKFLISTWRNRVFGLSNALKWRDFIGGRSNKSPTVEVSPEDLAVIQYTGGTTAQSKGVMLSHRNLVANALQTRHWLPDALEGRERFLCVVPIFHSYGLTTAMNVPASIGAAMILKTQFQTLDVLKTIKRYKPTIFPGSPNMYVAINNFRGVRQYGVGSIKACISGSAPLPVEVQEAFEKLTRGRLVEGYGLTEASPVTHANPLSDKRKVGTIGIPLPSTEAKIVDLTRRNREVKSGHIGELAVRGPQVMMGYWKNPEATQEVLIDDGWLLTGDIAQADEDGYVRIIARRADMWYPSKFNKKPAFPRDVEEVIYEIPQVKEVAVTAVAGHPFAFVIAGKESPSPNAIIAYCKRRLPPHLVPRFVIFVDDFPRTFIGKVLRRELVRRYEKYDSK